MALFNEILVGRYNRFLQKLLQLKGGPPSPQLSAEISTALPLFNGRENRYLEGWRPFSSVFLAGPTAGQTEAVQLRNPAGSNVIAVLESLIVVDLTGASQFNWSFNFNAAQADLTNVLTPSQLDARAGGITGSSLIASVSSGGAGDLAVFVKEIAPLQNVAVEFINFDSQEIPIAPSTSHRWRFTTVNHTTLINIGYRERFLEESERF